MLDTKVLGTDARTCKLNVCEVVNPPPSVTVTVKLADDAVASAVPEIVPVAVFKLRPLGKVPLVRL